MYKNDDDFFNFLFVTMYIKYWQNYVQRIERPWFFDKRDQPILKWILGIFIDGSNKIRM